eukprot:125618-Pyramimonas_sp.AAC.2
MAARPRGLRAPDAPWGSRRSVGGAPHSQEVTRVLRPGPVTAVKRAPVVKGPLADGVARGGHPSALS